MTWKDILKQDEQTKIDKLARWLEINPFLKDKEGLRALIPQLEQAKGTPQFQQLFSSMPPFVQKYLNKP